MRVTPQNLTIDEIRCLKTGCEARPLACGVWWEETRVLDLSADQLDAYTAPLCESGLNLYITQGLAKLQTKFPYVEIRPVFLK